MHIHREVSRLTAALVRQHPRTCGRYSLTCSARVSPRPRRPLPSHSVPAASHVIMRAPLLVALLALVGFSSAVINCPVAPDTCAIYADLTGSTCVHSCPAGQFINSADTACVAACNEGEFVNSYGGCVACTAGYTNVGGVCTATVSSTPPLPYSSPSPSPRPPPPSPPSPPSPPPPPPRRGRVNV